MNKWETPESEREPTYPCSVRLSTIEFNEARALSKRFDLDMSKLLRMGLRELIEKYAE